MGFPGKNSRLWPGVCCFKDFWVERYCETTTLNHVQNDRPGGRVDVLDRKHIANKSISLSLWKRQSPRDFWVMLFCIYSSSLFVFQSFAHSSAATQTWSCLLNAYWFSWSLRFCSNLLCLQRRFPGFVWHLNFGQIIWPVDWSSSTLRIELILVRDQQVWTPVLFTRYLYIFEQNTVQFIYCIYLIFTQVELLSWKDGTMKRPRNGLFFFIHS